MLTGGSFLQFLNIDFGAENDEDQYRYHDDGQNAVEGIPFDVYRNLSSDYGSDSRPKCPGRR